MFHYPGFDPLYLILIAPAFLLAMWAQAKVHSAYAAGQRIPTRLTGAEAARRILDSAGLRDIEIEQVPGHLSDHYDPRHKVLRLSAAVYQRRSIASVGIAAHEAGHALQDAADYFPLVIRNAAVPAASFGSGFSFILFFIGILMQSSTLIWFGVGLFGCVAFFQVINLPVEFDASARAKRELVAQGLIGGQELQYVSKVLNAAAWTYVAATLQSLLTLLYFVLRATGSSRRD